MRRTAFGLIALLIASPASAQMTQYWLPNGPGGTTYNNPQGSLSGTYYNNALRRHADQHRWARQRQQQAGAAAGAGATGAGAATGAARQPQTASLNPSFRLNNTGGRTIREVYVSASTDSHWGPDRLGANVLGSGQRMVIQLPTGQCVNDVRVVFMDGQAREHRQVNTCALTDMSFR
ncbi:hypothetical protein [Falsiroseomonas sp.]|uniref:hypothetical protein n=1 Tax=Falsiroseomonas sp. TaxID=2870721 RepID=UPI0035614824